MFTLSFDFEQLRISVQYLGAQLIIQMSQHQTVHLFVQGNLVTESASPPKTCYFPTRRFVVEDTGIASLVLIVRFVLVLTDWVLPGCCLTARLFGYLVAAWLPDGCLVAVWLPGGCLAAWLPARCACQVGWPPAAWLLNAATAASEASASGATAAAAAGASAGAASDGAAAAGAAAAGAAGAGAA